MSEAVAHDRFVALALYAFPRRFRGTMAADLVATYQDFQTGRPRGSRLAMIWDLMRNGLAARFDDVRSGGGGSNVPGGEPRGLNSIFGDFIYGARILRKSPVFTSVAIASLAIGIGANTAVFSLLDAAVLRQLQVENPEELVVLHMAAPSYDGYPDISQSGWMLTDDQGHPESSSFSYPMYERLRDADTALADLTAYGELYRLNIGVDGAAELGRGQVVAGNYFDMLAVQAHRGRLLTADDDRADAPPAVVISHSYWQTRFAGAETAVGAEITLNGAPFTLVGVTPPGFHGALQVGSSPRVTVPLAHQAPVMRDRELLPRADYWWLHVLGRRAPGTSLEQVRVSTEAVFLGGLVEDVEATDSTLYLKALPGGRGMTEARSEIVGPLKIVVAVVVTVLLIACVNLANLLVARASSRGREIAVRRSLGASRGRVARQLLAESLMLAFVGAGLGIVLAVGLRDLLLPVLELEDSVLAVTLNARVLGFTIGVAVMTGLVFGIVPALRATGFDLTPALKDEPQKVGGSRVGLGRFLLVLQVGLSLTLLVVAGLFSGSLARLLDEATGFNGERVLTLSMDPRISGYRDAALTEYYEELARELRRIPGATSVGMATHVPVSGTMSSTSVDVEGYEPDEGDRARVYLNIIDQGFLPTFEIPTTRGRVFDATDGAGTAQVAVVNEEFIDQFLSGLNPVGRELTFGSGDNVRRFEIIGAVESVKYQSLSDNPWPAVHLLYSQLESLSRQSFAIRSATGAAELAPLVRAAVRDLDPDVSIEDLGAHDDLQRRNVAVQRTFVILSAGLSGVALLLSCIGLYGMLSQAVARRTREIGVRMALGARGRDVTRMIMREMRTVGVGVAIGLVASYYAVRGVENQLYELSASDPTTMLLAAVVLLLVAGAAALIPARRAARLHPVDALRSE